MLSAVAARKARLQSQGVPEQESAPVTRSPSLSPSPPPKLQPRANTKSKRKQDDIGASKLTSQKKRKRSHKETRNDKSSRYYQHADPLKNQDDLIILDESSDEDDSMGALSADEASSDEEGPSVSFLPSTPAPPKNKRAWSPSTPFESSNDLSSGVPNLSQPDGPLSTFLPVPGTNVFHLTSEETSSITGSSDLSASVLILKPEDRLALLGSYKLYVLRGSVTLSGVTLHSSPHAHDVYAPRSSPIPVLESLSPLDRPPEIPLVLPSHIQTIVEQAETALILQELQTGISGLGKIHCSFEKNFEPLKWQDLDTTSQLGIRGVQNLTRQSNDVWSMTFPASWRAAFDSVEQAPDSTMKHIYLVRGAKKSGKSTFARTLLNRLALRYRYVAFLECDLGQSEFTPGGMVALSIISNPIFGPPFTHPSIPYQSHYIGDTSPRSSPSHYLDAIRALVHAYELDIQHAGLTHDNGDNQDGRIADTVPLVVNTMGWTKGLGADLSNQLYDILLPSAVFDFPNQVFDDGFQAGRTPVFNSSGNIHMLEPIPPSLPASKHSASDLRQLSVLSYFHAVFPDDTSTKSIPSVSAVAWNTNLPLCAQNPYHLDVAVGLDMIALTGAGSEDVVPSELFRVLNGAIVGLLSCEPDSLEFDAPLGSDDKTSARIPYFQGSSPPSPSTSMCHGLALVRSLSSPTDEDTYMQILTPITPGILTSASPRVVVKGGMELPIWGFLDFRTSDGRVAGIPKSKVSYLKWGKGEGLGGEKRRTRRNLMRKGQA